VQLCAFGSGGVPRQPAALPNAEPLSAQFLDPDGYLLYLVANNVADVARIEMEQMQKELELMGEDGQMVLGELLDEMGLGDIQEVLQLMQVMQVDQLVGDVMTGEIALVLYDTSDAESIFERNIQPTDFDGALFVGIKDRQYLADMLDRYGWKRFDQDTTVPRAGRCTTWPMSGGGPRAQRGLYRRHAESHGAVRPPERVARRRHPACQIYCDFNIAKLHER